MPRTVTNKTSHLGRAGQFAAMAEILARGWNVAIPEVDVGDDVFVAQDDGSRLTRVQVKTSAAEPRGDGAWVSSTIKIPFAQLREDEAVPLTFAFAVWADARWHFVVVSRTALRERWYAFDRGRRGARERGEKLKGRPPLDAGADPDAVGVQFTLTERDVTAWGGMSFQECRSWEVFELLMQPEPSPSTGAGPSSSPALRGASGSESAPGSGRSGG